ncbi:BREX-2 system adenine-specific DNA-methyltransferase PglX [Kineosporiaceae bacterium SCSIO 59966]|nr:BREX-2 system adenine-specific DNA-methyltransferase PglX [Kineosporiaceae bacterium SCSIO 59966]
MTVQSAALLNDLQAQVRRLEDDLRQQVDRLPDLAARLRSDHARASGVGRTAESWTAWLDAQATQAAVSWVLGCVFVRFCEDNDLTDRRWIAGVPDRRGDGLARAVDGQAAWIQQHPRENDRTWLRESFRWLRGTRAGASMFPDTDFVWWWDVSADAAEALVAFFRRRDGDGRLVHRFDSPDWDTRFLGDLYQDLSQDARKRYALLQTPEFVEEFILDLTLDPALDRFGLNDFRMIDPTCGSGHFLLGAFRRLLDGWTRAEPGLEVRQRVERALDAVHGVDVNPAATAIAKFRLTVAALRACGATGLDTADAPDFSRVLHVATGDSLIWGSGGRQLQAELDGGELRLDEHRYAWEDVDQYPDILSRGRYHAVVGNPPYITVKDKALNTAYRGLYETCSGKYQLSVPFAELFFALAVRNEETPGVVGQITSNAFMKREFGKKVIEQFFTGIDLTHVIDTSGAYIPGHGTPTVILVGNRRYPRAQTLRAVLGIRGEPSAPADPAKGVVWRSIVDNINAPETQNDYVTVTDLLRDRLLAHPWSLSGGGADVLLAALNEASTSPLASLISGPIGFASFPGADDVFLVPRPWTVRMAVPPHVVRPLIIGELVRDWDVQRGDDALAPYRDGGDVVPLDLTSAWGRHLWRYRTVTGNVTGFGGETRLAAGDDWWTWYRWIPERYATPVSIAFAFVATHNHFVLDRGGKVFNRSAPVIKLPEGASEDDHLRLLGLLNSSTACFWLKQVSHNKGSTVDQRGARQTTVEWENFYEFTGTKLQEFPLPNGAPLERARRLDTLAQHLATVTPAAVASTGVPTRDALAEAHRQWAATRAEMIAVQEELDWEVYRLYGVLDEDLTYSGDDLPGLALGERAFEIVLARKMAAGELETKWFARHGSTPVTEIPDHWPAGYRQLVQRRIDVIESHPMLHLIERPECKRRWATRSWDAQQADALTDWVLDRLEAESLWRDEHGPRVLSVAQLSDLLRADGGLRDVLVLLTGRADQDLTAELGRLIKEEAVPYLAAHRYKDSGLRKRAEWERVWDLQRAEDRGEPVGEIPVPPKYGQGDFRSTAIWRHRGKLDVPKERFISYPGAAREGDRTDVLGWAGWDRLAQAQALSRLVLERSQHDGWDADRLAPLLAGLTELEPWLHQWHEEPDPLYGGSPAAFYTAFLDDQLQGHGLTRDAVRAWRPQAHRGRPASASARGRRPRRHEAPRGGAYWPPESRGDL